MYVIAIPWFWGYEKVMAGMLTVVAVEVVFALTEDFFWCDQAADIRHTYSPWGSVMQYPPRLKQLEEPVPHLMFMRDTPEPETALYWPVARPRSPKY